MCHQSDPECGVNTKIDKICYIIEVGACSRTSKMSCDFSIESICHECKNEESRSNFPRRVIEHYVTSNNPTYNTKTGNNICEIFFEYLGHNYLRIK